MVSGLGIVLLIVGGFLLFNIGGVRDKLNIPILNSGSTMLSPILNLSAFDIRKAAVNPITESGSFVQQVDEFGRPVPTFGTGF